MTLFDLILQHTEVRRVSTREHRGACPLCGGGPKSDRFIVWPEENRWWCRQCNKGGDLIQFLRDVRGLSFRDAAKLAGKALPESDRDRLAREKAVKAHLLASYYTWSHRTFVEQTDLYRELSAELEVAQIAYRALRRCPDLYTQAEKDFWEQQLADLYDVLPQVELDCDLLTYDRYQQDRLAWWRRERGWSIATDISL